MYELTCPACKHQVRLPFVRIGALATCRSCAHRFQVQPENVQRQVTVPEDTGRDEDNPLLLGNAPGKPPPPPRSTASSSSSQASSAQASNPEGIPISVLVGQAPTGQPLTPIQPVTTYQEPSEEVARVIAKHRARRRRRQRVVWIATSVATLVVILLVFVGYQASRQDVSMWAVLTGGGSSEAAAQPLPELDLSVTVVAAERIGSEFWREVDETFDGVVPEGRAKLINERMMPGPADHNLLIADVYTAGVDVIDDAVLHLMLVEDGDQIFARYRMQLMLLTGQRTDVQTLPITVSVPQRLADRADRVVSWIQVRSIMTGGTMFKKVVCEPRSVGTNLALKITAYNPEAAPMDEAKFYIRALNRNNETIGRWRVHWKKPIGERQRVEFAARTQIAENWPVHHWHVSGAGALDLTYTPSDDDSNQGRP